MEILDEIGVLRPRMGKRSGHTARDRVGSLRGGVLARLAAASRYGPRRSTERKWHAQLHRVDSRRVVIKAHVQRLTSRGARAAKLHLRYIERDGVEKDGSKGVLYGPDGAVARETFEQPRVGEEHQFRLIVSPEDADQLDLTAYVRRLMGRVEKDVGREIEWAAVNHHDTAHPHAHVVVRGVARDGTELRFDRAYISRGVRWRAQELATQELGPRHEMDVRRARMREVSHQRFTSLDREIGRLADGSGRVQPRASEPRARVEPSILLARLEHLEALGLAERQARNEWVLAAGWQKQLRALGERGDVLKQIHAALPGRAGHCHVVRPGEELPAATEGASRVGRLLAKGLSDEVKGTFYAVIETASGEAYHVPLDARTAERVQVGAIVSLETKGEPDARANDRKIAQQPTDATAKTRLVVRPLGESLEAQIALRGPVWLDQVRESSLASHGFGAEVSKALEGRRDVLRRLGIASNDPMMTARLKEIERRSVGEEMASRTGLHFLPETPDRFRGRVGVGPDGAPYAAVSDGVRFVLVPSSPELRALASKAVMLSRDTRGRLMVREPDRDLGR